MQRLDKNQITAVKNIIINRVDMSVSEKTDPESIKRNNKQIENISLIDELYMSDPDFKCNVHFLPIVPYEIRSIEKLSEFSNLLTTKEKSEEIKRKYIAQ